MSSRAICRAASSSLCNDESRSKWRNQSCGTSDDFAQQLTLGIGHRRQEQVEGPSRMMAVAQMAVADQLLINPAKLAGELAQALRSQEFFVHVDLSECPAPCRESRVPWLFVISPSFHVKGPGGLSVRPVHESIWCLLLGVTRVKGRASLKVLANWRCTLTSTLIIFFHSNASILESPVR